MNVELVAPCGMNCGICSAYLARKYDVRARGVKLPYCAGCRARNKQCAFLKKRCQLILTGQITYCFECEEFPCRRLETIDRRYTANYRMSMIQNLRYIRAWGVALFLQKEEEKWRCPQCGEVISCHNGICYNCGLERFEGKTNRFRWEGG